MEHIINSEEFIAFSRPQGDIEKNIQRYGKITPATMIDRIKTATGINEKIYDLSDRERFNMSVTEFSFFTKKVLPILKTMKKQIENFKAIKNASIANYKLYFNLLDKYEEQNFMVYSENAPERLVFGSNDRDQIREQVDKMIFDMKNPFAEMYHWCKGEIYDIQAVAEAIAGRDNVEKDLKKMEGKKKNTQEDLENVNMGKKTIRTLLKNDKDASGMINSIENVSLSKVND